MDVAGGVVRRGATAEVRWRLTDPAFSSASAIVVLTVRDDGGGVVARRRIPAVAVGERGTWSFRAAWPAGRYHVSGRAYDVAGMRQATASQATIVVRGSGAAAARSRLCRGADPARARPAVRRAPASARMGREPRRRRRAGRSACPALAPGRSGRSVTSRPRGGHSVFLDYLLNDEKFETVAPRLRRGAGAYAPSFYAPYVLAAALRDGGGRVVVAPDGEAATRLAADLSVYLDAAVPVLPARGVLYGADVAPSPHVVGERQQALAALAAGGVIVAEAVALLERFLPLELQPRPLALAPGEELDFDGAVARLAGLGYERVEQVRGRGEFAVRGGLIDAYPALGDPLRIDFWGDEVESLRTFSIYSQRTTGAIPSATVYAAFEADTAQDGVRHRPAPGGGRLGARGPRGARRRSWSAARPCARSRRSAGRFTTLGRGRWPRPASAGPSSTRTRPTAPSPTSTPR